MRVAELANTAVVSKSNANDPKTASQAKGHRVKYGLDHWTVAPLDYFLDYFWTIFGPFFGPFFGLNFGLFFKCLVSSFSGGWFIICSSSGRGRQG